MPELFRKAQAFERAFVKAGGLLGAGVDPTGMGGALPGYGDQRNYELLIEAGFTPVEAIQIMTLNGAKVLGVDNRLGSIAAGKIADLVVIRGNPDRDARRHSQRHHRLQGRRRLRLAKAARVGQGAGRDSLSLPAGRAGRAGRAGPHQSAAALEHLPD